LPIAIICRLTDSSKIKRYRNGSFY